MSQLEERAQACVHCGHTFSIQVAKSLNAVRSPVARSAALDGTLHHFGCPQCDTVHRVETTFGYMDVDRKHWVAVFPPTHLADWSTLEQTAHTSFWTVTDRAPMMWNFQATELTVRCVFGLDDLREKLRIWDAGLDDVLVELWKLELGGRDRRLRFVEATGDDAIFETGTDGSRIAAPLVRHHLLTKLRGPLRQQHPRLFDGPFVDCRRLATPG